MDILDDAATATAVVSGTVWLLIAIAALLINRGARREEMGGVHDRLDVLMGMRCGNCGKHIGDGALRLHPRQRCRCKHNQPRAADENTTGRRGRPARRRRRRARRGRHTGAIGRPGGETHATS